jgi:hypothetical protein
MAKLVANDSWGLIASVRKARPLFFSSALVSRSRLPSWAALTESVSPAVLAKLG